LIRIKNYYKNFKTSTLQKCINFLPDEYKNLDITIIIPRNKWHCLRFIYLKEFYKNLKGIFKKGYCGTSCIKYNKIFLYPFNYIFNDVDYGEIEHIRFINCLYHEIYHQYQKQTMPEFFKLYNLNDEYNKTIPYENQIHEIKAKEFASNISLKYSDEIFNIIRKEEIHK